MLSVIGLPRKLGSRGVPDTRAVLLHPSCWKQQISSSVLSPLEAFLGCLIFLALTVSFPSPHYVVLYLRQSHTPFFVSSRRCEFHAGSQPFSFPSPPSKDHVAITGDNVPISHLLPAHMAQARNFSFPPKQAFPKDGTQQRPKGVCSSLPVKAVV